MYEPITIERLDAYLDGVKELHQLFEQKQAIEEKIGSLSGIDYTRTKVSSGNSPKDTEQERFAIALEKVNQRIDELKFWTKSEHSIITTQIARVKKWNYRKVLVLRYIEKWKWSEITQDFFWLESDYEEAKDTKYRETIMRWNRQAITELENISNKPYKPITKQLHLPS